MALDSWLTKMKSAISVRSTMKPSIGILAFEVSSLMSKLLHLWRSLSDSQISKLRHETIALEGVRKVVSDDDDFLLRLACAEFTEILRSAADSISNLTKKCTTTDQELRAFDRTFKNFVDSGSDPNRWAMTWKEMDSKAKKMDRHVASTASLYKEMEELSDSELALKKQLAHVKPGCRNAAAVSDAQQKIYWRRQEIKCLKQSSLWGCSVDGATFLLARVCFTIAARVKHVFGIGGRDDKAATCPRNSSVSAAVYPSSSPLSTAKCCALGLYDLSTSMISCPPETTLGAAALAMQYANVVTVVEKMIRAPGVVGPDARDDLYGMLPGSVRGMLRRRLRGIGYRVAVRDEALAVEWMNALNRIVEWLCPLAGNTMKWQGERSFERRGVAAVGRSNVMVLETLYFANREKVEAAVTELLVGLNYVWRFEMEMRLDR